MVIFDSNKSFSDYKFDDIPIQFIDKKMRRHIIIKCKNKNKKIKSINANAYEFMVYQLIASMSRKGNCWDNAVAESFFHTIKNELIYQCKFKTREEAKNVIFEYIEVFYNRIRAHSTNDYLSPVEYENIQKIA